MSGRASTFGGYFCVSREFVVLVVKQLGGGRDGGNIRLFFFKRTF